MIDKHIINKSILDVRYTNEAKAKDFQDKLSRLFNGQLKNVLDEVLTRFDKTDKHISIPSIELDLGVIAEEKLERDFPDRLKEQLEAILLKLLGEQTEEEVNKESLEEYSDKELYLRALTQFLQTGSMPWWFGRLNIALDELIDKTLTNYGTDWVSILKRNSRNKVFITRLVGQFGEKNVIRLIRILEPAEAEVVIETAREIQYVQKKEQIVQVAQDTFERQVWELVLHYLLNDRGSYFNTKSFVHSVLTGMAAHLNIDFISLLREMKLAVDQLQISYSFKYSLPQIVEELHAEEKKKAGKSQPDKIAEKATKQVDENIPQQYNPLIYYLERGSLSSDFEIHSKTNLLQLLDEVLAKQAKILIDFLWQQGKSDTIRWRTIQFLEEERIRKVIPLLKPENADFILGFADELQKQKEKEQLKVPVDQNQFRLLKWDFILKTILIDRGSVFNTKVFILKTIQYMAAHFNWVFEEMLSFILDSVSVGSNTLVQGNVQAALLEIKKDQDIVKEEELFQAEKKNRKAEKRIIALLVQKGLTGKEQAELVHLLEQWYTFSFARKKEELTQKISKKITLYTANLVTLPMVKLKAILPPTLFDQLQKQSVNLRKEKAFEFQLHFFEKLLENQQLERKEEEQFIHWLNDIIQSGTKRETEQLIGSPVFKQFLQRFTHKNLEKKYTLSEELQKEIRQYKAQEDRVEKRNKEQQLQLQLDWIVHQLEHQTSPWWEDKETLPFLTVEEAMDWLMEEKKETTKKGLIQLIRKPQTRLNFIQVLPEKKLLSFVGWVAPAQKNTIKYYNKLVEKLAHKSPFQKLSPSLLNREKWEIILATILEERGSRFNLKSFILTSIQKLAGRFNIEAAVVLKELVSASKKVEGVGKSDFAAVFSELQKEQEETDKKAKKIQGKKSKAFKKELPERLHSFVDWFTSEKQESIGGKQLAEIEHSLLQLEKKDEAFIYELLETFNPTSERIEGLLTKFSERSLEKLIQVLHYPQQSFLLHYESDWKYILQQLYPGKVSEYIKRFKELSVLYLIRYKHLSKHDWFAQVLRAFVQEINLSDVELNAVWEKIDNMDKHWNSTIVLSINKWKSSSFQTFKELDVQVRKEKTTPEKVPEQERVKSEQKEEKKEELPEEIDQEAEHWVNNSGLVLIWPFLQRYFTILGLLNGTSFKSPEAAYRGVHLLQYLVKGTEHHPEYDLILNKILCGIDVAKPLVKDLTLTEEEKQVSEDMLNGIIANWTAIGNTSTEGLRTTFLQREGKLNGKEDNWDLHVEQKPFDVLIDRLPWSYKTIKLPWMKKVIYTQWR